MKIFTSLPIAANIAGLSLLGIGGSAAIGLLAWLGLSGINHDMTAVAHGDLPHAVLSAEIRTDIFEALSA